LLVRTGRDLRSAFRVRDHGRPHSRTLDLMAENRTYRAATSAYVLFGVWLGILAALTVLAALKSPSFWTLLFILVGIYAFVCFWLAMFQLSFSDEGVTYSALFSRRHSVRYSDIRTVVVAKKTGPFESPLTISVKTRDAEVRINSKVFPREAVRQLMALRHEV
jgi:hypothetical protein